MSDLHRAGAARKRGTGTSKAGQAEEFLALLDWPGLYHLSQTCDEMLAAAPDRRPGRSPDIPTSLLLAVSFAARICGSQAGALTLVSSREFWNGTVRAVWSKREENDGLYFPSLPPRRDQVRHYENRLIDPDYKANNPRIGFMTRVERRELQELKRTRLATLQERFQVIAMRQAKMLGQFDRDAVIDWTQPDRRHTVIGDGTVITPYSDVREHRDPVTGEVFYSGTRAKAPRLSPRGTLLKDDGKEMLRGLNMVSLLTPTQWGWVILGTGYAERAEQWAALDLVESVAARAKGGIHNLLWDRVFTGWLLDSVMANQRIRVFNKSVASNATKKNELSKDPDFAEVVRHLSDQELDRLTDPVPQQMRLAEFEYDDLAAARSWDIHKPSPHERHEKAALVEHLSRRELRKVHESGQPLPVGISIYAATSASTVTGSRNVTNCGAIEVVRSRATRYTQHTHPGPAGSCTHDLWIDDGALHSVEQDPIEGHLVKTATATCLSSTPHRNRGRWATTEVWSIPCPHGDIELTTTWQPAGIRYNPDDQGPRPPLDPLNDLRPISRSQAQRFADIANDRNQAESFNKWYKSRLPQHGRAASLSIERQTLDYLGAAAVRNALTWDNWRRDRP